MAASIVPAASVLLSRGPGSREVLLIHRGAHLRFFGDFWAFPGGKIAPGDPDRVTTAARELFEEVGVLLARDSRDRFLPTLPDFDDWRDELLSDRITLPQLLERERLHLAPSDFALIGTITTPDFAPQRYATTFYVAHCPPEQAATVRPGELSEGRWCTPREKLAEWSRAACLLSPPSVMTLELLGDAAIDRAPSCVGPVLAELDRGKPHPIVFAPHVRLVPLRSQALAPATHTNAYLVGSSPRILIDPGSHEKPETEMLFSILDPAPPTAVVLSHHHRDHVAAAQACADRYGIPVLAHPRTAQLLQGKVAVTGFLNEGDRIDLGTRPDGSGPWHLDVLHTPGHAPGHLTFWDPFYRLLIVGDMISTLSTILIAPPDGDLAEYVASLQRLRDVGARLLLPAHGNVSADPKRLFADALEHRRIREQQLLDALAEGLTDADAIARKVYRGLPDEMMRFARLQVEAGLAKLRRK